MITINQAITNRKKRVRKNRKKALDSNCQKKGTCLKVTTMKPKKPNSANRKIAKVRLSNRKIVTCYIPGEGHTLQEFSTVLVRGGRTRDLPGLKYRIVRGKFDLTGLPNRRKGRSKYGTKKPVVSK